MRIIFIIAIEIRCSNAMRKCKQKSSVFQIDTTVHKQKQKPNICKIDSFVDKTYIIWAIINYRILLQKKAKQNKTTKYTEKRQNTAL